MIRNADAFDAVVDDLRALMHTFLAGDWRELHVTDGDTEIFIARDASSADPLLGLTGQWGDAAPAPAKLRDVTAPHICTVDALAVEQGGHVREGDLIATVSVLDQSVQIHAPCRGMVSSVAATPGALAEFGTLLVQIAEGVQ
jgi:acetyl/propionyl-CoA carboxylase alpha subunit